MGIHEVSSELFGQIQKALADGKVTEEEKAALRKAGLNEEIIQELSGMKESDMSDHFTVNGGQLADAVAVADRPAPKKSFWNTLGGGITLGAIITGATTLIGAAVGALAGGVGAGPGAAFGFKAGLALGALFGLGSCTKDAMIPGHGINVNQEVKINIDYKNDSVEELIAEFKKQDAKLDAVIDLLAQNNRTTADILAVLTGLGAKADQIINLLVQNNELLENISHGNEDIKNLLVKIYDKVAEGVQVGVNNNAVLNEILNKLAALGDNDAEKIKLLKEILAKITEDVEQDKEMNEVTKNLLNAILAKLGTMDANQQAFFEAILAKLDKIGDKGQAALEELLAAINANTAVAKGSQEILAKILEKLGQLGDKADVLIDLVSNLSLSGGGTVDLSKIEALLTQILAKEDENGKVLTNIYDKIDLMKVSLEAIKPALEKESDDIKTWLELIFNKIKPCEGHNCDHSTLEGILAEIKILIEQIKDATKDPKHEGILDDLDDIFG